jgi:hypothetical protein
MSPYCTNCGSELTEEIVPDPVAEAEAASVEIERIRAEKEVAIARIQAKLLDEGKEVEIAADEAVIEVLENEIIDPVGDEAPEDPQAAPVVMVNAPEGDPPAEEPAMAPPPVEGGSEPQERKHATAGWYS